MANKKQMLFFVFIVAGVMVVTAFIGCGCASSSMPNPAAEKCIRDGFELEPIVVDGVPRGYRCVDPRTGKSCEVWQYYRNECNLSAPAMPNPAAEKCIRDGFELEPIVIDGVPREYRCVDPRTGKSCEVWQYYRNQCELSPCKRFEKLKRGRK